jgi:7-carboxy-7-deazaguanine synthase
MRISELFYSLQGEGLLAGVPSIFIRTAGCNLACRWCDTRYARDPADGTEMSLDAILARLGSWPRARHCVVTGGEPTRAAELPELTRRLAAAGLHITIETNATTEPGPLAFHLASLSPKLRHAGPGTPPIDPERLRAWIRRGECQLKLVCAGTADLPEILALQAALAGCLPPNRILLMPLTTPDPQETRERRDAVVRLCLEHGFRYAGRLHLDLFGGRRGA